MQSLAGSSFPLPTPKDRRWGWKFQALNHGLVFLVTCSLPKAIEEPKSPYLNKRLSYHPGNSKRFGSLVSDSTPITEEITKILGDLYQESKARSNCWNKRSLCAHVYKGFSVSGTGDRERYVCVCVCVTHTYINHTSYYFTARSKDCELIILYLYSQSRNLFLV